MSPGEGHHHHHHGHSHHHHHHVGSGRLGLAFALNFSFAIIELIGGLYTNSVAIMSDALHDFGDSLALLLAWILEKKSTKDSNQDYSYGYRRYSPLAALVTGLILLVGSIFIVIQAVPRLLDPVEPKAGGMILLALLGVGVNGFAALKVSKGTSLNERMVTLHLLEDVLGWVLVLVSAIVMYFWHVPVLDAALACVLAVWILYNVFKNLRQALGIFLQATPKNLDQKVLMEQIKKIPLVEDVHHSHIWSMDGEHHVFTTHLVLSDQVTHAEIDCIKSEVKKVARSFHIFESTVEIEFRSSHCEDPKHS